MKTESCEKTPLTCDLFAKGKKGWGVQSMIVILGLLLVSIPGIAQSRCPAEKKECNCACKHGAAPQVSGKKQNKCATMQYAKNCAKKNKSKKAKARGCGQAGPAVCAQPPMPPCAPDMMCAQVMPPPRWFTNRCEAEKERATVMAEGACQRGGVPQ
jgi:hypothetical protein